MATQTGSYDFKAAKGVNDVAEDGYAKTQSRGEQLITNGNGMMGDNSNFSTLEFDGSKANGSPGSFTRAARTNYIPVSDEFFPIDASKDYLAEFDILAGDTGANAQFYAMLMFYDVDKNPINVQQVSYFQGSTTTLARDLNNGDTVVYLTSVAGFKTGSSIANHQRALIFWDYTNSKGYTYPPETYSRNLFYVSGGCWADSGINTSANTITLSTPYNGSKRVAGTYVSQNSSGGTYAYFWSHSNVPSGVWTHVSGTYSGTGASNPTPPSGKFWKGAAYAKIGFLWNYQSSSSSLQKQLWVTNISVMQKRVTKEEVANAAKTATKYITDVTNGIMVHPENDSTTGWKITDVVEMLKSGASYLKMWLTGGVAKIRVGLESSAHSVFDNTGMEVFTNSNTSVAKFGSITRVGKSDKSHVDFESTVATFYGHNGTFTAAKIGSVNDDTTGIATLTVTGVLVFTSQGSLDGPAIHVGAKIESVSSAKLNGTTTTVTVSDDKYNAFCLSGAVGDLLEVTFTTKDSVSGGSFGYFARFKGPNSLAVGRGSESYGPNSVAIGYSSKSYGNYSVAMGDLARSYGDGSVAEGLASETTGMYSHAEGYYTKAKGWASHTEGFNTIASGDASHAQNNRTIASSDYQTAIGKYNVEDANDAYAFIIGNGTDDSARSNAFTVNWNGGVELKGTTYGTNTFADNNPKVVFHNADKSQSVSMTFTDYDAVQGPASLTLNGNQGGEYFIAPNIRVGTQIVFPGGSDTGIIKTKYNGTLYNTLRNHNNGNVSLSATGTGLYIGYENTTLVNWLNGKMTLDSSGNLNTAGDTYVNGRLHLTMSNGSWIDMRAFDKAAVNVDTQIDTTGGSYRPIMNGKFTDGSWWTFGGISKQLGIWYYTSGRTENGNDGGVWFDPVNSAVNRAKELRDYKNGNSINISYNDSGLSDASWICAFNGYSLRAIAAYGRSSVGTIDWGSNNNALMKKSAIAYWNGAYSGTLSNLAYCNKGAFGFTTSSNSVAYSNFAGNSSLSKDISVAKSGYVPIAVRRVASGSWRCALTGFTLSGNNVNVTIANHTSTAVSGTIYVEVLCAASGWL